MPVDEASAWTADLSARLFASDEARAGMAAYLEKRPAPWLVAPEGAPAPDDAPRGSTSR
jgi:hypothetical protein